MVRYATLIFLFFSLTLFAQQTGALSGVITDTEGSPLPGVTISAESATMPQGRDSVTNSLGRYRLLALLPGEYTVTATLTGLGTAKSRVRVLLGQTTELNLVMGAEASENLIVSYTAPLVSTTNTAISATVDNDTFDRLPVGESYQDLVKLAPGIQVTNNGVRGPSSGGSGQDNIYKFDGVDVSLPMFGTLSAEPSTHDIAEVNIVKGGSKALNFNRSGGFSINTVSKAGTNQLGGALEYRMQPADWEADRTNKDSQVDRDTDEIWMNANVGGPLLRDRVFFYASYYAPSASASNSANLYGDVPDFDIDRDEYFFKLTMSPGENLTLHASYRDSTRKEDNVSVGVDSAATTAENARVDQIISIVEGDWIASDNSSFSFKWSNFDFDTSGLPSRNLSVVPSTQLGSTIDLNNLADMGLVRLPNPGDDADLNALYQRFIDQYGYVDENGNRVGGGQVGYGSTINVQDFKRSSWQLAWDYLLVTGPMEHDLHIGFRHETSEEDLARSSNGWGSIRFGDSADEFLFATFLVSDPNREGRNIHSEFESNNFEINDSITMGKWNFNLGFLFSNDKYYGQDLENDSSTVSGFRLSPGSKYLMYEIDYEDAIQPRLGIVRELRSNETIQFSFGSFNPPASSLPRAASWARNVLNRSTIATFNSAGQLVEVAPAGSSSGKFFQENMKPRRIDEVTLGYSRTYDSGWTSKTYARYRKGDHFWEDTNNTARTAYASTSTAQDPTEIAAQGDYIPELSDYRAEIGGSSYVIAELDYAFTKYYEVTVDAEKRGDNYYFKGTYTWSHYYGNFDQDSTSDQNDQNIFIGSSFLADGGGRQTWDNRYGNLAGDRRHVLKAYGTYQLPWASNLGAFALYQSGEPWETHSWEPYAGVISSRDRDDTSRFAEPAGSRTSSAHYQLDLNYSHAFTFGSRYGLELDLDIFNVFDKQTGYNIDKEIHRVNTYGKPRSYWAPRRFRLSARFRF